MRMFFFAALISLFAAIPSFACEPRRDSDEFSLEDYVNNADLIFVGTISGGEGHDGDSYILIAEVEVSTYLKGSGDALIEVSGFGYGVDCLSIVHVGDEFIFFVKHASDGSLTAAYLSAHDAVIGLNPEAISQIQALTGQANVVQANFFGKYGQLIVGGLIILAGIGIVFLKAFKPNEKAKREEIL